MALGSATTGRDPTQVARNLVQLMEPVLLDVVRPLREHSCDLRVRHSRWGLVRRRKPVWSDPIVVIGASNRTS
jgi:hypothetical protein